MPEIACPECRGRVDVEARVCRHCFTVLRRERRHDAGAPAGRPGGASGDDRADAVRAGAGWRGPGHSQGHFT
ncbi:MAG TPA: hypothetical protein VM290_11085 [Gaiellaceae bacterium]|nr:hypothetical protein [Gaiellaceae bacterium]